MNGSIAFSLFFVLFFSYGVVASLNFVPLAKIFPFSVSCVALGLALINLGQDIWRQKKHLGQDSGMGLSDLESDWDIPHTEVWKRAAFFIGLFGALYVGIWVAGFPLAMSLFVALFYRQVARASLLSSGLAGAAALGFMALVAKLMNVGWPEGLLSLIVDLPWPLG